MVSVTLVMEFIEFVSQNVILVKKKYKNYQLHYFFILAITVSLAL